jgi:Ca2+-binding EF-hand superfamily protein
MRGLAEEYLQVIENERKDQVMVVYKDVITALTDHYVIDLAITSSLNDVISEVINAKFRSMLSPLLPSSAVAQMRARVKKFADESRSPEPRPGQGGRAVGADLSESDRLLLENDEPRILKAELPSLFILAGLFTDETSERTGDPTPRDMADGLVLKDASENTFEVQACKLGDFSKKARLPSLMMKEIENVLNSRKFCSLPRRQNLFLTPPEVVKCLQMLYAEQVWFDAFLEMVTDFEIYRDDAKLREKKVRTVFDKWSGGNGLMPASETTNALLQLTDGGLWLKAVQGLLIKINTCSVYGSGGSFDELQYPAFKTAFKKYSGAGGYIDKARVKDFVGELIVEQETEMGRGLWFEAYVQALERLDMTLGNKTMLNMFREVDTSKDGFLQLDEFIKIFRMICKRGIWKTAYLNFLKDAHLQIPEEVQNKFWNWLNEGEQNPGLVPMKKFVDALEEMVYCAGILPSVLTSTVNLMGLSVPESELRVLHEIFDMKSSQFPGFMEYGDLYQLFDKLGRRGMPFSRFKPAVAAMGFKFDEKELYEIFSELDINQDASLDWNEFRGGLLVIVKEKMPEAILMKLGLSKMDVIQKVCIVVLGMGGLFAFLILALKSFGGGKETIATIQSTFASAITMGANQESSGGLDLDKYRNTVTAMIAASMGLASIPK